MRVRIKVLACLLSLASLLACGPVAAQSTAPRDWDAAEREAVSLLQQLIRIDTINPPTAGSAQKNADETALLRQVQSLLEADGIAADILESEPGRGNLVARLKGTDPSNKGLLLMAHVDTVSVDPAKWRVDPLSGAIQDGYLWGRGTLDDKGAAALMIQAMRLTARSGTPLKRDLILMLNADEESGGDRGAQFMLERHWDKIDPAFALNEGGRIRLVDGAVETFSVQAAEKVYHDVRIWVRGESGHSSVPRASNAIYSLGRVLERLAAYRPPLKILPAVAGYFGALASREKDPILAALMRSVAAGDTNAAEALAGRDDRYNALLRSTVVPTLVEGGIRENVLPPDASVNLNIRLLPGERVEDMIEALARAAQLPPYALIDVKPGEDWKAVLADWNATQAKLRAQGATDGVYEAAVIHAKRSIDAPASPLDNELVHAIDKAGRALSPQALFVPMMTTGATDSRFLRARGVPAYGLLPTPVSDEDMKGFHDHNERVKVDSVGYGLRLLMGVIDQVCR
jgi:acetylornithine deacetylase/succinyl-diaminopimelate desuccinylase-like protein